MSNISCSTVVLSGLFGIGKDVMFFWIVQEYLKILFLSIFIK